MSTLIPANTPYHLLNKSVPQTEGSVFTMASAGTMDSRGSKSLESSLLEWAVQEMKFDACPQLASNDNILPSVEDMRILCQGPMVKVWKYMIQHVKSVQTADHVKGNLALGRQRFKPLHHVPSGEEGEVERLHRERSLLQSELKTCTIDVETLEKELEHSNTELTQLDIRYQSVTQRVRDLQREESLLSVACARSKDTVAKYNEYSKRIAQRTGEVTFRGTEPLREDEHLVKVGDGQTGELQSESCRDVWNSCGTISQLLHDTLNGSYATNQAALEKAQLESWNQVKKTSSSRRVCATVRALVENTHTASSRLRDQTVGLDIASDAQELSFSYKSSGKIEDISSPPGVQKSVQQLLLAANRAHVLRFFQEQEHKNESWKLEARLADVMAQIHKQLQHLLTDQPANLPLARSYVDALISAAVEKSVIPCLRAEMDGLVGRIHTAKQEKERLHSKHACIQNFKSLVEKKQNLIAVLARQNTSAPDRLGKQREQVKAYVASHAMQTHNQCVDQLVQSLKDSLSSEVEKFCQLLLSCLLSVQLDSTTRVGVTDLSLAPSLHPLAMEKNQLFTKTCAALDFPSYKSADGLGPALLHLHCQLQELQFAQRRRDIQVKAAQGHARTKDDIQAILVLCEKAREHRETQCQRLMPRLDKCQDIIHSLVAQMEATSEDIIIWTDQPAQHTTPWVVTEGMTFDQWMHKWRVAVTQVHKMMAMTQHSSR